MGSSSSSQFKPTSELYVFLDYKYCKVWVRKSDKVQQMEQYLIHIHNSIDYQQYQKMFLLRLQNQLFPNNLYFMAKPSRALCGNSKLGSILIQRIPYRLCQFKYLLYLDGISILYKCLKGYSVLYQKYGFFNIKTTMICLDQKYNIKVWHHTDLSSPFPEDPFCKSLKEMIQQIICSIQRVCSYPYNINRFSEYLQIKSIKLLNFQSAIIFLEKYTEENEIKITNQFKNIERFLKEAQGLVSLANNKFSRSCSQQNFDSSSSHMNKSITKYSFRNDSIICVSGNSSHKNSTSHLYFNPNSENRSNSGFKIARSQEKSNLSYTYSPESKNLKNYYKINYTNTFNQGFNYQRQKSPSLLNTLDESAHFQKVDSKLKETSSQSLNSQSRYSHNYFKMNKVNGVNKLTSSRNGITQTRDSKSRIATPSMRSVQTIISTQNISLQEQEQYIRSLNRRLRKQSKNKDRS